jgi:hypothetical protein
MTQPVATSSAADTGDERRWRQLSRTTGIAGLAFLVLVMAPIIAASGQEPGFDGQAEPIQNFFRSTSSAVAAFGSFVVVVGVMALVCFAAGLGLLLVRAERQPAWRSVVAFASAVVFAAVGLNGYWEAASYRAATLTPELAVYAFDLGNIEFANSWVALGSFAGFAGWVIISTRFAPRWLGWLAVVGGLGLVLSRAAWTSSIWYFPYLVFWIWVIILSAWLIRRSLAGRQRVQHAGQEQHGGHRGQSDPVDHER